MNDLLEWLDFYLVDKVFAYGDYTLERVVSEDDISYILTYSEDGFIVAITDTLAQMQHELERIAPIETWLASEVIRP